MVLVDGISVDPGKVEVVLEWQRVKTPKEIRSFLGLTSCYTRFMEGFAKLARLSTKLTRNNTLFRWSNACERSFLELKNRLTLTSVLTLPIEGEEYDLYTNTSHKGLGEVLMQKGKVIAYTFRQLKIIRFGILLII